MHNGHRVCLRCGMLLELLSVASTASSTSSVSLNCAVLLRRYHLALDSVRVPFTSATIEVRMTR